MGPLIIEATKSTPAVIFDPSSDTFELSGRSLPENALTFYQPVIEWLSVYAKAPNKETTIGFKIDYFNTPSAKPLLDILKFADQIAREGSNTVIYWYHNNDDDDMKEVGEEFSQFIQTPVKLIAYT